MALFGLHTPIFGPLHAIIGKLNAATGLEGFTATYIPFGNAAGGLDESANLTYDGTSLTVNAAQPIILGGASVCFQGTGSGRIDAGDFYLTDNTAKIYLGDGAGVGVQPYWYIGHNGANMHIYSNHADADYLHIGKSMENNIVINFDDKSLFTPGNINMGDATIDCGIFKMTKGARTDDPYYQIELSADNNGDAFIGPNKGDLQIATGTTNKEMTIGAWGGEALTINFATVNKAIFGSSTGITAYDFGALNIDTTGTYTGINVTSGENPGHTHTGASLSGIDISEDTNLVAGTNITLVDDTLNVDDAFLVNDASDETSGTITAAGFTTAGTVQAEHLYTTDDLVVDGLATIGETLTVTGITHCDDKVEYTDTTEYIDQEAW